MWFGLTAKRVDGLTFRPVDMRVVTTTTTKPLPSNVSKITESLSHLFATGLGHDEPSKTSSGPLPQQKWIIDGREYHLEAFEDLEIVSSYPVHKDRERSASTPDEAVVVRHVKATDRVLDIPRALEYVKVSQAFCSLFSAHYYFFSLARKRKTVAYPLASGKSNRAPR